MPGEILPPDNQEIAVLTRVNELALRWKIKPYDFIAHVEYPETSASALALHYDQCPHDADAKARFFKMLAQLGMTPSTHVWSMEGTAAKIIDALDNAIDLAPRISRQK